jgi:hypothetical protein
MMAFSSVACRLRHLFHWLLLALVLMPTASALGHETRLDFIYDSCLESFDTALSRRGPNVLFSPRYPPPTRIRLRNPNHHTVNVCIYDNVCHKLVRTVRLFGRSETSVRICADDSILGRGSILVLYRNGQVIQYDNLRSAKVILPAER